MRPPLAPLLLQACTTTRQRVDVRAGGSMRLPAPAHGCSQVRRGGCGRPPEAALARRPEPDQESPIATQLTVTSAETTTPGLRRVWFRSDDLSAFAGSTFTDRYVKLVVPRPGVDLPGYADGTLDLRALRATLPPQHLPAVRTYTALFPDVAAGTLAIDFVLHGDGEGVAGPWAAAAQPGDTLLVTGPGGAYAPDPSADWHLLIGDESALPAITAAVAALPADAVARLVLLCEDARHEPDLTAGLPAGTGLPRRTAVTVLHRADGHTLLEAVAGLDWPAGRVHVFAHGEAEEVMHGLRPHLLRERGLDRRQVSISGYWRRGRTEEGFREWKQALAAAESGQLAGA